MTPLAYSLQFRGTAIESAPGLLIARTSAPGCSLVTTLGEDGLSGRFESASGDEAVLRSRIEVRSDGTFVEEGTITVGREHVLRFRTLDVGRIGGSPDPGLQHGSAVWAIEGGEGQFEGASGRIASNFVLSDTGELTDNHLGLVFLPR